MKNRGGLLLVCTVILSGIMAAAVLNDAGAITVFSILGSRYGYSIVWELAVAGIFFVLIQEMISRMAVVTGKGLSDLIREKFGVKWTFIAMIIFLTANICSAAANFSGIALALGAFNISRYISIPCAAIVIWLVFLRNNCKLTRKVFIVLQIVLLFYMALVLVVKPDLSYIAFRALNPEIKFQTTYFILLLAVVGVFAAPYIQFYIQSSIVEKSIPVKKYGYQKIAICIESMAVVIIDFFIIAGAFEVLGKSGIAADSVINMSAIFIPLSNRPYIIYTAIMFSVSVLACFIIPSCTAFSICQSFGFESGEDNKIKDAPVFSGIFLFVIILGSLVAVVSRCNFFDTIVVTQAVVGVLSSAILVFIIKIANDPEIMEDRVNRGFQNFVLYVFILFSQGVFLIVLLKLFT